MLEMSRKFFFLKSSKYIFSKSSDTYTFHFAERQICQEALMDNPRPQLFPSLRLWWAASLFALCRQIVVIEMGNIHNRLLEILRPPVISASQATIVASANT